jgi:hypothetical protein
MAVPENQEEAVTGHAFAQRVLIAGVAIFMSSPAHADAIDGDWCSTTEAKQFSIAGASITTPAGTHTTGDYSRHAFAYIVPDGDPGAGQAIVMQLMNEEEVRVSVNGGEPKIWRRCELIS